MFSKAARVKSSHATQTESAKQESSEGELDTHFHHNPLRGRSQSLKQPFQWWTALGIRTSFP